MQVTGEEIYNLPVSDQEMKGIVNSVYEELPEIRPTIMPFSRQMSRNMK